jgi:DNA-directed RNA polymerase specialized sigma24 family protein
LFRWAAPWLCGYLKSIVGNDVEAQDLLQDVFLIIRTSRWILYGLALLEALAIAVSIYKKLGASN